MLVVFCPSHGRGHRFNPCTTHQKPLENDGVTKNKKLPFGGFFAFCLLLWQKAPSPLLLSMPFAASDSFPGFPLSSSSPCLLRAGSQCFLLLFRPGCRNLRCREEPCHRYQELCIGQVFRGAFCWTCPLPRCGGAAITQAKGAAPSLQPNRNQFRDPGR